MANRIVTPPLINLAGSLLVAAPDWQDKLFSHTVCLVVHHSSQRAIGVVLNRHMPVPDEQLLQQLAGQLPNKQAPNRQTLLTGAVIHFGGPQAGPVVALHNRQELAEFTSAEGVYFAAQIQNLQRLLASPSSDSQVKIIVGQADWQAGELDRQFTQGKWLPLPVSAGLVFADDSHMWRQAMFDIGDIIVSDLVEARVCPSDILTN